MKEAARLPTSAEIKENQQEQQQYHWTTCPLSHLPLGEPVVSDFLGNLYNKDAVLEFLLPSGDGTPGLSKSDNEEVLGDRVRTLRDVVEVKFHRTDDVDSRQSEKGQSDRSTWVCPITKKAMGPGIKAVYLVPCGHAFEEIALREISGKMCLQVINLLLIIPSDHSNTHQCSEPYSAKDVINILPVSAAEKECLTARMQNLKEQGLTHSLKKASGSRKKRKKGVDDTVGDVPQEVQAGNGEKEKPARVVLTTGVTVMPGGGIKNAATASLTAKVLAIEQEKTKRRKLESNANLKSLFSSGKTKGKDGDFMTRGFSIPAGAKR